MSTTLVEISDVGMALVALDQEDKLLDRKDMELRHNIGTMNLQRDGIAQRKAEIATAMSKLMSGANTYRIHRLGSGFRGEEE